MKRLKGETDSGIVLRLNVLQVQNLVNCFSALGFRPTAEKGGAATKKLMKLLRQARTASSKCDEAARAAVQAATEAAAIVRHLEE